MHDMYSVRRKRRMYTNVPDCTLSMHDQKNARSVHGDMRPAFLQKYIHYIETLKS